MTATDDAPEPSAPEPPEQTLALSRAVGGLWREPQRLLVVAPAWVGDMVMAQVLLQVLRRRWPHLLIDLLAPPWTAPLGTRMAEVRDVIVLDVPHRKLGLRARRRVAASIRDRAHDWAIVLPNSLKSALIPYWAGIPVRTGYGREGRILFLNDRRKLDKRRLPRTVDRFVFLGLPPRLPPPSRLPPPHLRVDTAARATALQRLGLSMPTRPMAALAPGAEYGPAKRWPLRHWVALGRALLEEGYAVWLFGSPKDGEITASIAAELPEAVDLGGKTGLLEAADLLSLATVTVSNDSGLMHVAGAVGSRVIGLFGPSPHKMTPPLSPNSQLLRLDLPCSPCGKRICPLKHHRCMEDLSPSSVLQAIKNPPCGGLK